MISLVQLRVSRKILGVDCNASKTEIKSAFRKKATTLHPDRWDGRGKRYRAYDKWYNLLDAYHTLIGYESPAQRNKYRGYIRHAYTAKFAMVRYEPNNQD